MSLLSEDALFLNENNFEYYTAEDKSGTLLVIKNFLLPEHFSPRTVDLMVIIPSMYPMAAMDMFWVTPEVKLVNGNRYPVAADIFEVYLGIRWQRFSRHYLWRPGIDNLESHLRAVKRSLVENDRR